jgi:diacylglycerol kinase (ATP)
VSSCVILNPQAGSSEKREFVSRLDGVCHEIAEAGQGEARTREALEAGVHRIIAAGGDGTISEVVRGILATGKPATLGLFPMGTGNDLARTLAIPDDPEEAIRCLERGEVRSIDVIRVSTASDVTYAINACAGGFSGQVDERMSPEMKATWGPLAYLMGAASTLPDLTEFETNVSWEDGSNETIQAMNVIVANGRTVGGGKRVAPFANPEDGLLDVVIVDIASVPRLAEVAARLLAGNYLDSELVRFRRTRRLEVSARPGMWFNVDGDLFTDEPVTFEVLPKAINVIVGPTYVADPPDG